MTLALCALLSFADEPFRNHRYDSWKSLTLPDHAIVFVGNSITDMHPWTEAFGNDPRIVNRGCSGAVSVELIEHVDSWVDGRTDKVFLMIGTNDLGWDSTTSSVVSHVAELIGEIRNRNRTADIYIQSILPARDQRNRTMETLQETNEQLKELAIRNQGVEYIDLFEPLKGILLDEPYSLDRLHLEALGYKIWCETIMPYVGLPCTYAPTTADCQETGGLGAANGMRATYFSTLPVDNNDILFFGDELVKCGEWNELLHSERIKNRGTGWGRGGNIQTTMKMVEVSLSENCPGMSHKRPSHILLYTGSDDVIGSNELVAVEESYKELLERTKELAPNCPITVIGLVRQSTSWERISEFNDWLQSVAKDDPEMSYVDINQKLTDKKGRVQKDFMQDDYLYHKGYEAMADAIRVMIGL